MTKPKYLVLDLETTGLDPNKDGIIEIGAIAIDERYHSLGSYTSLVEPSEAQHARLLANDYVCSMHTTNGLLEAVKGGIALSNADRHMHSWLTDSLGYLPGEIVLAGHTISFDHSFIRAQMPLVGSLLSHRMLDFSAMSRLLRELDYDIPNTEMPHRALADTIIELEEFQTMMRLLANDQEDARKWRNWADFNL